MGTVDIYLLKVLSENKSLTLSDIVIKFQGFKNLENPPGRTALYQRLNILKKKKNLVDTEWQEGHKFYKIRDEGREKILTVTQNLAQAC